MPIMLAIISKKLGLSYYRQIIVLKDNVGNWLHLKHVKYKAHIVFNNF